MFRISVKEVTTAKEMRQGEWRVIDKRPYTGVEVEKANSVWRSDEDEHKQLKEIYGYTSDVECVVENVTEVYTQEVDGINLKGS